MRRMRTWLPALALLVALPACGDDTHKTDPGPHVIYIDIDDHGLSALWDSNAPTLQKMAREGAFAFSRADLPTHSNHSNITLLTGAWPEVTDVPHNSWLDRANGFREPFRINASLSAGSYIFYDQNPLGSRVQSIYSAVHAAGKRSMYVGLLPPFEHGADEVHFSIYMSQLLGFLTISKDIAEGVLRTLHYPDDVISQIYLDGPPHADETLNQYTLRDAAEIWTQAAKVGNPPPQLMFVWDFIALDNNPTNTDGAAGPAVRQIVEDIDKGLAQLVAAVNTSGYGDRTSYVITLDHGKVDAHNQVVFESQLANLISSQGAAHGVTIDQVKTLNEDGDVLVYAATPGAGTAAGIAQQRQVAHGLVELIQAGQLMGVDTSRTITWDGYLGTHRFYDIRSTGPNNPDLIVFPQADWTLNDVAGSGTPGPIGRPSPYGRHGGFSVDELYVPAIFYGPAFKGGVVLPTPINHPDVAPTVAAALGIAPPSDAEGAALVGVLAGDPLGVETMPFPDDPHAARGSVLGAAGFEGSAPHLPGPPAEGAVIIDVSGLSEDDFPPGSSVAALAQAGVRFTHMHTRFRDWPVTEYQLLTGTYPPFLTAYVPFAEDDPAQSGPPGWGEFKIPPAPDFKADPTGYALWHSGQDRYEDQTIFDAAKTAGLASQTALLGAPDFHLAHIQPTGLDITPQSGITLDQLLRQAPHPLVVLAVDGGNDAKGAADAAVGTVRQAIEVAGKKDHILVVLTSRGAAAIDAPNADAHGPGSARHVPLVIAGPNVRAGVVSNAPATPGDIAPTVLYALGATARDPDLAFGVQLDGGLSPMPQSGPLPMPHGARDGHVLMGAFSR
jgi:arylsulfatase A-like enzyme